MADTSGKTTRARSIVTLDGYVSRGRSPPSSVPRDHKMLQEFAMYLELRLKSHNVSMLRRIFADFINEQQNTLVAMMQQGCTIVTLFPVLRTSSHSRQQAELLLHKPKFALDPRGCVFSFLQYRTATRNMALLKHLFLEFVARREAALMHFVARGCEVISVIPFQLPQIVAVPPPVQKSTRAEERGASPVAVVKKAKKGRTGKKVSSRATSPAVRRVDRVQAAQKRGKGGSRRVSKAADAVERESMRQTVEGPSMEPGNEINSPQQKGVTAKEEPGGDNGVGKTAEPGRESKRRSKRTSAVSAATSVASSLGSGSAVVAAPKRGRKTKTKTASAVTTTVTRAEAIEGSATATAKKSQVSAATKVKAAEALLETTPKSGESEPEKRCKRTSAGAVSVRGASKKAATDIAPSLRSAVAAVRKRSSKPTTRAASRAPEENDVTTAVAGAEARKEDCVHATAKKTRASAATKVTMAEALLKKHSTCGEPELDTKKTRKRTRAGSVSASEEAGSDTTPSPISDEKPGASSATVVNQVNKGRKGGVALQKVASTASLAVSRVDKVQVAQKRGRGRPRRVMEAPATVEDDSAQQQDVVTPKETGNDADLEQQKGVAASEEPGDAALALVENVAALRDEAPEVPVTATATKFHDSAATKVKRPEASKRGRKPKPRAVSGESHENALTPTVTQAEAPEVSIAAPVKPSQASVATTATAKKPQASGTATVTEKTPNNGDPELDTKKRCERTGVGSVYIFDGSKEADTSATSGPSSTVVVTPRAESDARAGDSEVSGTASAKLSQPSAATTVTKAGTRLAQAAATAIAKETEAFLAQAAVTTTTRQAEDSLAGAAVATAADPAEASLAEDSATATVKQAEARPTGSEVHAKAKRGRKRKIQETTSGELEENAVTTAATLAAICVTTPAKKSQASLPTTVKKAEAPLEKTATSGDPGLDTEKRCKCSAVSVCVSGARTESATDAAPSSIDVEGQVTSPVAAMEKVKKGRQGSVAVQQASSRSASPAADKVPVAQKSGRGRPRRVLETIMEGGAVQQQAVATPTGNDTAPVQHNGVVANDEPSDDAALENTASCAEEKAVAPTATRPEATEVSTAKQSQASAAAKVQKARDEAAEASFAKAAAATRATQAESSVAKNTVATIVKQALARAFVFATTAKRPEAPSAKGVVATTAKEVGDSVAEGDLATIAKLAKQAGASLAEHVVATTAKQDGADVAITVQQAEVPLAQATVRETVEQAEAHPIESKVPSKAERGRKRKAADDAPAKEKSHKRGKPAMSDAMCRSQLELAQKMVPFVAQIPWEVVFANLPAPFDELKHPALSGKYRKFWRLHARAVWERNFWFPLSRKKNLLEFNTRNNRQLKAKNGFESIIVSAYQELGAAFFVVLDSQKHPGWWYRGPVVALFALQQIKSEEVVWDYVKNEALERFPDCKLPLPLKSPNSGALSKRHARESDSMWMANHRLTPEILIAIAEFKAKLQAETTKDELQSVML